MVHAVSSMDASLTHPCSSTSFVHTSARRLRFRKLGIRSTNDCFTSLQLGASSRPSCSPSRDANHFPLSPFFFSSSSFRSSCLRICSSPSFRRVNSITSSVLIFVLPACLANASRSIAAFPAQRHLLVSSTFIYQPTHSRHVQGHWIASTYRFAPKPAPSDSR